MELTRKRVIQRLVMMKSYAIGENYEALEYAISSLKTDEVYQLMYEGVDVYDKDAVARMFKELQLEIEKMSDSVVEGRTVTITSWKGMQKRICKLIQEKISVIRGDIDEAD